MHCIKHMEQHLHSLCHISVSVMNCSQFCVPRVLINVFNPLCVFQIDGFSGAQSSLLMEKLATHRT